jgi:GH25 family lysozyme M1 (1,4-beta-N-acetylmuramidase)
MTEQVRAVDVSNYTGPLNADQVAALRAEGIGHVVVRLSLETPYKREIAVQQLRGCVAGGLTVSGYLWVYGNTTPADVGAAVAIATEADARLCMLWLDLEEDGPTVEQIRGLAHAAIVAGVRPGIYTGRWWWWGHFGNPADFADIPLWDANYGLGPRLDATPGYGGWTSRAGHQYAGTSTVGGVGNVDLDVFRPEYTSVTDDDLLERELYGPLWLLKDAAWRLGRQQLGDILQAAVVLDKAAAGLD